MPRGQGDLFVPLLLRQGGLHLDSVKQLVRMIPKIPLLPIATSLTVVVETVSLNYSLAAKVSSLTEQWTVVISLNQQTQQPPASVVQSTVP